MQKVLSGGAQIEVINRVPVQRYKNQHYRQRLEVVRAPRWLVLSRGRRGGGGEWGGRRWLRIAKGRVRCILWSPIVLSGRVLCTCDNHILEGWREGRGGECWGSPVCRSIIFVAICSIWIAVCVLTNRSCRYRDSTELAGELLLIVRPLMVFGASVKEWYKAALIHNCNDIFYIPFPCTQRTWHGTDNVLGAR